ncbi:DUF2335 domain-containing protein [Beijerinckia indica]|uniref:DUF2335 domain-containing protein n=1 Tax=Beijerinckia indica subsp. indica (strain ATCC 9039 / DSM 1715 / NCIMB 8712) TaxID=395963 RepID=B2ICE0_BEII9|nr:DUF2335 domain-containing protein [Beijerinckia indica]ACB96737.1 conserved hypothetical protein [Beijerinckia indica subsp. indica ATCC 9039]
MSNDLSENSSQNSIEKIQPPNQVAEREEYIFASGWSGPLPPPQSLEAFEQILPGSASLIFGEFVKEAEHRRKQEDRESRFRVREGHIGQVLAGLFSIAAFGVTCYALYLGAFKTAVVIGTTTVISGIAAFLNKEQKEKQANEKST